MQKKLLAEGKTGPEWHYWSRPPRVEAEGVHHLMTFAELTGATPTSCIPVCEEALERSAGRQGARRSVWIETLIQYLAARQDLCREARLRRREVRHVAAAARQAQPGVLWNALASRASSQTVATDHAPFDFKTQKEMGRGDFTKIPNGIPSLEDRVNLLYTYGVNDGQDRPGHAWSNAASTQAAKIFGLFPRKGTIAVGSDADLVVYDPAYRGTISATTHTMNWTTAPSRAGRSKAARAL